MAEVIILFEGYTKTLELGIEDSNCSCVLIKGQKNIIVNTMTPWDKDRLIEALASHGLKPEEIHFVVCTCARTDHVGNNNLFTNALHYVACGVQTGTIFTNFTHKRTFRICDGVTVLRLECRNEDEYAVIVDTKIQNEDTIIAITGDVFKGKEDIVEEKLCNGCEIEYQKKADIMNRNDILRSVHYIIPGHGPMFPVTERMRDIMSLNLDKLMYVKHVYEPYTY